MSGSIPSSSRIDQLSSTKLRFDGIGRAGGMGNDSPSTREGGLIDLKLPRNGAEGLCQTQGKLSGDPVTCIVAIRRFLSRYHPRFSFVEVGQDPTFLFFFPTGENGDWKFLSFSLDLLLSPDHLSSTSPTGCPPGESFPSHKGNKMSLPSYHSSVPQHLLKTNES